MLRKQAAPLAAKWLRELDDNVLAHDYMRQLKHHLLAVINDGCDNSPFIYDDDGEEMPIVVFSRVSPNRGSNFLLHMMLVLGEFDTELDLRAAGSMKDSLAMAKLIPTEDLRNEEALYEYGKALLSKVVHHILPLQPVTMPVMDEFIVKSDQLIQSILLRDTIPITDMPACILADVFNQKTEELEKEWKTRRESQLDSMMATLRMVPSHLLPDKKAVMEATKENEVKWDPLSLPQAEGQSDESVTEQKMALSIGVNAVNRYCKQFRCESHTKGVLNNGAPGAGKSFVLQAEGLFAMCRGLRVMSTSLMAVRSNALGGLHLHRFFKWQVGKKGNLFCLSEVSSD
jgi:hypothetical protein